MKRIGYFIIIIISLVLVCGCDKKDKEEYKLIELQGSDLLSYLSSDEDISMILALYYDYYDNSESFMNSLKKVLGNVNNNIYYVDIGHLDSNAMTFLFEYLNVDYSYNSYLVYDKRETIVSNTYSDYYTLLKELKDVKIEESEIPIVDKETKLEALKIAQEEYDKGNIGIALDYVNKAWDLEEAKEAYKNNKYYALIKSWEAYHMLDKETARYIGLDFYMGFKEMYLYEIEDNLKNIKKPDLNDMTLKYFKIEDNIVYVKDKENSDKYYQKYRIMGVNELNLQLADLNTNIIYNFVRRIN